MHKLILLGVLVFAGLFIINGVFSFASFLGFTPTSPQGLAAQAAEIGLVVWVYEKFTHKEV